MSTLTSKVYSMMMLRYSPQRSAELIGVPLLEYKKEKKKIKKLLKQVEPDIAAFLEENIDKPDSDVRSFESSVILDSSPDKGGVKIQHVNLDNGKSKIEGVFDTEPKTPEEIIELLKIDTSKWRLSQFWNKEKNSKWYISALVTQIGKAQQEQVDFLQLLSEKSIPKIPNGVGVPMSPEGLDRVIAVFALQDIHFGKEENADIDKILMKAVEDLIQKATNNYYIEDLVFVVGGDLLNMDTFNNQTTKGTELRESGPTPMDTYLQAYNAVAKAIGYAAKHCGKLHVAYVPGNHDRLSSYHLAHALSVSMSEWSNIIFHVDYKERRVLTFGKNMIGFEHGDVSKNTTPLTYATEFPLEWGKTFYRVLYTGHYHTKRTKSHFTENEINGFKIRTVASLSNIDYYHHHNKFTGNIRSASLDLYDIDKGQVAEFIYNV